MESARPLPAPGWALALRRSTAWLTQDLGGGPRVWKLAWIVNFQKGGTFWFLGGLMAWYGNTSTAAKPIPPKAAWLIPWPTNDSRRRTTTGLRTEQTIAMARPVTTTGSQRPAWGPVR